MNIKLVICMNIKQVFQYQVVKCVLSHIRWHNIVLCSSLMCRDFSLLHGETKRLMEKLVNVYCIHRQCCRLQLNFAVFVYVLLTVLTTFPRPNHCVVHYYLFSLPLVWFVIVVGRYYRYASLGESHFSSPTVPIGP